MNDQLLLALENETNASIVELNSRKIKEYKKNIFDQLHLSKEQIIKISDRNILGFAI